MLLYHELRFACRTGPTHVLLGDGSRSPPRASTPPSPRPHHRQPDRPKLQPTTSPPILITNLHHQYHHQYPILHQSPTSNTQLATCPAPRNSSPRSQWSSLLPGTTPSLSPTSLKPMVCNTPVSVPLVGADYFPQVPGLTRRPGSRSREPYLM